MAQAQTFNFDDYGPYEPGEFLIDDISASEIKAPALVPGIMSVVAIGFVYIPGCTVSQSQHVMVKSFNLSDNLAGNIEPVTKVKLKYDDGAYAGRAPVKNPFKIQEEFQMTVQLAPDKKGVDGGFLRVIFYYDQNVTS
ncbi:hypothetical protein [uncultured Roseibium sp.]|uniref:hypothetical protein n=1 Tax=uncultured Roseibium sp. TaxID=1936171 RepID=UPI00261E9AE2|nr:hypothetical protein [uncultured Roseibium sp.]